MKDEDFEKYSIPTILFEPTNNIRPIGIGSCCIVHYKTCQFVFTVGHVASHQYWGLDSGYENLKGIRIVPIGTKFTFSKFMDVLNPSDLPKHLEHLQNDTLEHGWNPTGLTDNDFAFAKYIDSIPLIKIGKGILSDDLTTEPNENGVYGFYGLTRRKLVGEYFERTAKLEKGLKFMGKQGNYFQFKPNVPIKEHSDYQGCSGAPILDQNGRLVALVKGGDIENNIILGSPTSGTNKLMVDIECLGLIK